MTTNSPPVIPTSRRSASTLPVVGLLAVTATWGSTFFLLSDVVERIPVPDFLALRFVLALAAVWLVSPRSVARLRSHERRQGVLLGAVYGAGQLLQTVGLETLSASVSGFVTGMYVVFTPLLAALVLRSRLGWPVWTAVGLATVGLGVLSLQGVAVGAGEALTLLSALCYAVHIVGLGVWSRGTDTLGLAVVQLATVSVVCGVAALPGGVTLPSRGADWVALLYMALVAGALALILQTWAQAHLAPTRAAVIMTLEPVWAAGFAVALGGERLGPRVLLGGLLVLAAMYLVELGPRRRARPPMAADAAAVPQPEPVAAAHGAAGPGT